jgi:hypothetical protein
MEIEWEANVEDAISGASCRFRLEFDVVSKAL